MAKRMLGVGVGGDGAQSPVVAGRPSRRQTVLRSDPMPDRVERCLALLSPKAPVGPKWAFEVKWDGYRLAIHIERGKVPVAGLHQRVLTCAAQWAHTRIASAKKAGRAGGL